MKQGLPARRAPRPRRRPGRPSAKRCPENGPFSGLFTAQILEPSARHGLVRTPRRLRMPAATERSTRKGPEEPSLSPEWVLQARLTPRAADTKRASPHARLTPSAAHPGAAHPGAAHTKRGSHHARLTPCAAHTMRGSHQARLTPSAAHTKAHTSATTLDEAGQSLYTALRNGHDPHSHAQA